MKKRFLVVYFSLFIFYSCSDNKTNSSKPVTTPVDTTAASPESFLPVTPFLQGQLALLDSLQVTILQISSMNGKEDSTWISKEKMIPQLQPFVSVNIDKENLIPFFKETKFNDQSTEAVTFTYDPRVPLPDSITIRHWDVYVDPEKGNIKRVYIVQQVKEKGILLTRQLTWQTGKWAKIVTISGEAGTNPVLQNSKWVWDFNE